MEVDGKENRMPRALDDGDDSESKVAARRVVFERRREKANRIKVRKGHQKPPKDRDWILKKKEVRRPTGYWPMNDRCSYSHCSFIDSGERRMCLMTRSTPLGNDGLFSDVYRCVLLVVSRVWPMIGLIHLNTISYSTTNTLQNRYAPSGSHAFVPLSHPSTPCRRSHT
jgi:hypothetical protein